MAFLRGLTELDESAQQYMKRDTRPVSMRILAFFHDPHRLAITLFCFAGCAFIISALAELFTVVGIICFVYCFTRKTSLPFRMPAYSGIKKDYNDISPGSGKPKEAQGIYFFGNENETNDELWFTNEDMRTHVLIFGSTGSGKTETLISLAYNALLQGSGFIYVDGKGDNGLFAKIFSMVRSMGREDDILLINFMTGARDIVGPQKTRLSNTINPFASGSSSMLSNLVVSLMDSSSGSSDGDMWKGRAIGFVESLMRVLVAMRDAGYILLDANSVRNYFHLSRLESIVVDKLFIRDGEESISLDFLPYSVLEPLSNYVLNLPGYNKEKKGRQVSQVLEQHGFITMQLTRVFTSLADTYGHILRTNLAEVDLSDVVLNRRILCVLLPALEKSPDELSNLGKVIIATLRAMMAGGLGDSVEGDLADIVDARPTNAETPFLCILDEYGYYAVEGFAVVPAQARSLGFSVVFAGQDLPAFQKASKEEAASIGANTNIKICMKLEDPTETWDFFMKSAGESYVTQVDTFQVDAGSVMGNYADGRGARYEKRARIDLLDLKEQGVGEFHIFFKSKVVRARSFYANPKRVKRMRLNHFLKIARPNEADIVQLNQSLTRFSALEKQSDELFLEVESSAMEVEHIVNLLTEYHHLPPLQRSLIVLNHFNQSEDLPDTFIDDFFSNMDEAANHLNVFIGMQAGSDVDQWLILGDEEAEAFKQPLLARSECRDHVEYIERLTGKSGQQSMNIAVELIADMDHGTSYPPEHTIQIEQDTLIEAVDCIIAAITAPRETTDSD